MPRKPRQLPAQNTLPYLLLTLTALCGEYPIRQISHLPGGSAYLESVVTALRRDGLLRTFSKDGLRGLRLTSSAKRLLLADAPEWFSAYLTGSSEPNKLKSEISRRLRLHRMAEILTIMHNADIPAFPWEKAPFSAASQSAAIPAYYTSREVKEIGPQGAKIKSSRATGILLTDGGIFLTYNTAKAQMKWEYKAELRFKALLQTEGVMPDAEISGIVFGSTMEQLSILTQLDAHSYFLLDGSFPHFYYLTNDRMAKRSFASYATRSSAGRSMQSLQTGSMRGYQIGASRTTPLTARGILFYSPTPVIFLASGVSIPRWSCTE